MAQSKHPEWRPGVIRGLLSGSDETGRLMVFFRTVALCGHRKRRENRKITNTKEIAMYSYPLNICPSCGQSMRCLNSTHTVIVYWCPICNGPKHEFKMQEDLPEVSPPGLMDRMDRATRSIGKETCKAVLFLGLGYAWAFYHYSVLG